MVFVSLSGIGIEHSACGVYHGGTGPGETWNG